MLTFRIKGQDFPLDDSVTYRDFYLMGGKPNLVEVRWADALADMQSGRLPLSEGLAREVALLDRWVAEAPRKRFYRDLVRGGSAVLSGEEFFPQDGGEEVIAALERTGHVARRFLEAFFPETAARCKGPAEHHPARRYMVEYAGPGTEAVLAVLAQGDTGPRPPDVRREVSAVDRRRLADGAAAKARLCERPATRQAAEELFAALADGALALQSTDDLGTDEWNAAVAADLEMIQARAADLRRQIDLGRFDPPAAGAEAP